MCSEQVESLNLRAAFANKLNPGGKPCCHNAVSLKQQATRPMVRGQGFCLLIRQCQAHPSRMSVEAMIMKAFAVSLKPPKTRLMVRNSCPRPSLCLDRMAKPSRPDVLSATTFSRHCHIGEVFESMLFSMKIITFAVLCLWF